jgi:hypothetical protein
MEQLQIHTYPAGLANKLGQDVTVQRLNELNRFDNCLVVDLDDGDQYFVHPKSLPQRTADDILNFMDRKCIDVEYRADVEGKVTAIDLYSFEHKISHSLSSTCLKDCINYLMDMDPEEL